MNMEAVGSSRSPIVAASEEGKDASFMQQLKATIVRNWLRKMRNRRQAFRETFTPIWYMAIILVMKYSIPNTPYPAILSPRGTSSLFKGKNDLVWANPNLGVTPNDSNTRDFVNNHVLKAPQLKSKFVVAHFYADESSMQNDSGKLNMGIVFTDHRNNLDYTLRTRPDARLRLPSTSDRVNDGIATGCRGQGFQGGLPQCSPTNYFYSGFLTIQSAVEMAWLKKNLTVGIFNYPNDIKLQLFPKDQAVGTNWIVLRSIIPLYLVIALSQFIPPMLTIVVEEKEKKIKESLRMVGLRSSVFWLSWFAIYSIMVTVVCLAGSLIMHLAVLEQKSNFFLLFILMLEFGFSMILFAFVLTTLFSKAKTAAAVGALSTLMVSALYYLQVFAEGVVPNWGYWLLSLMSPPALSMAVDKMMDFVSTGSEIDLWDDSKGLPIAGAMIMILIDIILYGLLAYWLDQVLPTEYGTKRPLLFFIQPSFWSKKKLPQSGRRVLTRSTSRVDDSEFEGPDVERVTEEMRGTETLVISNIKKTFTAWKKPPVHALRGVSLKIYPNEITAILGHNGAGKSTLFNILTGMTSPSSGNANICGFDIKDQNQMEEIRKMTGICPQHDVLFDDLTTKEHLQFFARIRGMNESDIEQAVTDIIKDVDLVEKTDVSSKNLSGGQKRKLSVGIALIGDPKVIFLDEPTAGVDPYSRRHLWTLLKQKKEGKMILLTTHFMDEADFLGDRKAIISHGTLRCYGSSLFLKNRFGLGYHLTMVLKTEAELDSIERLIQEHVPESKKARLFGKELSYILPRENVPEFPALFGAIEADIQDNGTLGIDSYGTSMPTLEEVFLRLGDEDITAQEEDNDKNRVRDYQSTKDTDRIVGYEFDAIKTQRSSWQTFKALAYVRMINKLREPAMVFVQFILPIGYAALGIYLSTLSSQSEESDAPLLLSSEFVYPNGDKNFYGYQNFTGASLNNFDQDFPRTSEHIPENVNYTGLLEYKQDFAVLQFRQAEMLRSFHVRDLLIVANDIKSHILPLALNDFSKTMATFYGVGGNISLTSHPFKAAKTGKPSTQFDGAAFSGSIFLGFTYTLVIMGFAMELIYDRQVQAKNQLRVNGLSYYMYYGSFLAPMMVVVMVFYTCLLVLAQAFQLGSVVLPPAFTTFALLYFIFPFAGILFASTVSYPFNKVESGNLLFMLGFIMGFIPFIIVFILKTTQVSGANALHIALSFMSPLYIPFGIFTVLFFKYAVCQALQTCDQLTLSDYMQDSDIYCLFIACFFHMVFWFVALKVADVVKDGGSIKAALRLSGKASKGSVNPHIEDGQDLNNIQAGDEDVVREREEVIQYFNQSGSDKAVAVKNIRKLYNQRSKGCNKKPSKKAKLAVNSVSFGVANGEVFGLLGPNGAGKTTTMKMITAEESTTKGQIKIGSHMIESNDSRGFEYLGYCPQFDAVWKNITIREHLNLYAAIRGVPPGRISSLINQIIRGLKIEEHEHKRSQNCSGGTKRKLSYAMSMLGDPKIVLLDEPSSGMDPQTKRFVWDTILASFKGDRGAILTTHAMEEADALCNRVGIMVKGELRCLGSTQHLKNKYGGGYILDLKCSKQPSSWDDLHDSVTEIFESGSVTIDESLSDRRTYSVSQAGVKSLGKVFESLERLKNNFDVEEYSFGQSTLEQVFIKFAKEQEISEETSQETAL